MMQCLYLDVVAGVKERLQLSVASTTPERISITERAVGHVRRQLVEVLGAECRTHVLEEILRSERHHIGQR